MIHIQNGTYNKPLIAIQYEFRGIMSVYQSNNSNKWGY